MLSTTHTMTAMRRSLLDPATLATAAGTALVAAMATDAWKKACKATVSLWRRVHPDGTAVIEAELAEVRGEVLEARRQNDTRAEEDLAREWRRRLLRLLHQDIDLVPELQQILNETWLPALNSHDRQRIGSVTMAATATGHGRVYQAAGNQVIKE
jgi:hypothetical protein